MSRLSHILAGTLLLFGGTVSQAQTSVDTSNWACRFCTYAAGWFGSLDFGPAWNSDEVARYTDYRGLDDDGMYLALDGMAHYRGEAGGWLDLAGADLGTGNRRFEVRGGRRGSHTLWLDYSEVSRYRGYGARSPFLGVGTRTLTLPATWQAASDTSGMSALATLLHPLALGTERRTLAAGIEFHANQAWQYEAKVSHMEKTGLRTVGAGVFTVQSSHIPVPVDFAENRFDFAMSYSSNRAHWRLSLDRSWFNNANALVTWQNPFTPLDNTSALRTSLEPDSDAWRAGMAASFTLSPALRLSAQASVGRAQQDDALLPYSINPDFDNLELPRTALGQELDVRTTHLAARLSARLSRKLKLNLSLKSDERDNRTPVSLFTPVITDLVQRPETPNRPYSFERREYAIQFDYYAGKLARLNSGVKRLERERSLQSVRETSQDTWWGEISFNRWSTAQLRLRLETSNRDIAPYDTVNDPGLQENLLLRKFNLAGRERRRLALELDLMPSSRFSASLAYYRSRDVYQQSILGLLDSDEDSFNLDLAWSLGKGISAHAFASLDYLDSNISGAESASSNPWSASTADQFKTFGAGINGRLNASLELGFDLTASLASGMIQTQTGANEAPFPELSNRLHNMRLWLAWRPERAWGLTVSLERERFESSDWQIDGVGPDTLDAILTLGAKSPGTRALFARIQAHYRF